MSDVFIMSPHTKTALCLIFGENAPWKEPLFLAPSVFLMSHRYYGIYLSALPNYLTNRSHMYRYLLLKLFSSLLTTVTVLLLLV